MIKGIIEKWTDKGITLNGNSSEAEISALEKSIDFRFPEDFKSLYLLVNGFKNRDWTPNMFSFFPLDRIKEEYEDQQNDENFVPICDYLISSHHIGFSKNEKGIFKDYEQMERVCDNIYELIELIDQDSALIY